MVFAFSIPAPAPTRVLVAPVTAREIRRQRAKLWELNPSVHCSVIGTCLTTAELRSAMGKVLRNDVSTVNDHDLHSRAVGLCERQGEAAKVLHKTLDRRHELAIRRFARLEGETAALDAWIEARRSGDIAGAYWALLTHPDTGHDGMKKAFGDVHMLSHLVGAANRADIRRLTALEEENAALRAKVERQQLHLHEAVTSRDVRIRQLGALVAAHATPGPTVASSDDDALDGFRHLVSDLQSRLEREVARRERLEQRVTDTAEASAHCARRADAAEARAAALQRELLLLEGASRDNGANPPTRLPPQRILYVGGRPAAIEQMRGLLTTAGGTLLSHDGGRHDHPSLLPGLIGQADQVVFPVDCVSHDAALTVKRICRRLGKRFTPLRSSGLASFLMAVNDTAPTDDLDCDVPSPSHSVRSCTCITP